MSRKELDRDIDVYLARRRQQEKKSGVKMEEIHMPPEVETYDDEKPKRSWLAWLFGHDDEEKSAEEVVPEKEFDEVEVKKVVELERLRNDLKEVARFSLEHVKDLPPDKLHSLKSSSEFEKFKEILRRNGIIK